VTLDSLVERSSRLDQRHWKHGCRTLTVCSVVWPDRWLWRTEAHHDDLLTQRQAYTDIKWLLTHEQEVTEGLNLAQRFPNDNYNSRYKIVIKRSKSK